MSTNLCKPHTDDKKQKQRRKVQKCQVNLPWQYSLRFSTLPVRWQEPLKTAEQPQSERNSITLSG